MFPITYLAAVRSRRVARAALGAVVIAVSAATALAAGEIATGPGAAVLLPASLPQGETPPAAVAEPAPYTEIQSRIETAGGLSVAGQRLHGTLLRQFYAAHNYQPVWPGNETKAAALTQLVLRAADHGLDPDLFHGTALRNIAALSPIDRDLLLSDAFLSYADALARGALPIEDRMDDEDLTPEPVDVAAVLDRAIASPDPAAIIEALAPNSPEYLALRRALQAYRAGVPVTGRAAARRAPVAGASVASASVATGIDPRLRAIEVNLERLRWLPRHLPSDRVWVNLANAQLVLYRSDRPIFTSRVVIGQLDKQTPELQTTINSVLFNPPWNVPRSIVQEEILPKLSRDPGYLARHHMVWRRNGGIEQLPGHGTALGQLKFEMIDRFDVYLHDTPQKALFGQDNRRQSHGCVRVQNPRELAALLLNQPIEAIDRGIAAGTTNRRMLPTPMPVFLVYQTAFIEGDGSLAFRADVYDRDQEIWQHLHPMVHAPIAEHEPALERRG